MGSPVEGVLETPFRMADGGLLIRIEGVGPRPSHAFGDSHGLLPSPNCRAIGISGGDAAGCDTGLTAFTALGRTMSGSSLIVL